jgi:hypothetical protein
MVLGTGSHELASPDVGCRSVCTLVAQALARSVSKQAFTHPTVSATFKYRGLGRRV